MNFMRWLWELLRAEDGVGRVSVGAAIVIALGGGLGAYYVATNGGTPPPPGTAQLWVDTNGGTCTRVPAGGGYVDAAACGTFAAADSAASAGDLIYVKGGTYGSQTLSLNKVGSSITFQEAPTETVNVGSVWGTDTLSVTAAGGNLIFKDMGILWLSGGSCSGVSSNVTFNNIDFGTVKLQRTLNWKFTGGDIGPAPTTPSVDAAEPQVNDCYGSGTATTINNTTEFDGVYFHDVYTTSATHTECLLVTGVDGLWIHNSTFYNCDSTGSLYITRWNICDANCATRGNVLNVLIENNFFLDDGAAGCQVGESNCVQDGDIQLENDAQITFRNNSFAKYLFIADKDISCGACADTARTVTIQNNYGRMTMQTGNGVVGSGNVWYSRFGGTDNCVTNFGSSVAPSDVYAVQAGCILVVNRVSDLHLPNGVFAIDKATAPAPAADIDGQARPIGPQSDAGADEHS